MKNENVNFGFGSVKRFDWGVIWQLSAKGDRCRVYIPNEVLKSAIVTEHLGVITVTLKDVKMIEQHVDQLTHSQPVVKFKAGNDTYEIINRYIGGNVLCVDTTNGGGHSASIVKI